MVEWRGDGGRILSLDTKSGTGTMLNHRRTQNYDDWTYYAAYRDFALKYKVIKTVGYK